MVDLTRRGFLKGLVAVGTVAAMGPLAVKGMLTLYADGIHDDTEALQALFDGEKVIHDGTVYSRQDNGAVYLRGGTYRVSNTLHLRGCTSRSASVTQTRFSGPASRARRF